MSNRRFRSLEEMAFYMERAAVLQHRAAQIALDVSLAAVAGKARAKIGSYQKAAPPFAAWAPLSEATLGGFRHPLAGYVAGKIEEGYGEDPLLRTGDMRATIKSEVDGDHGVVGSTSKIALYQEVGTTNGFYPIPPRSFLGSTAVETAEEVVTAVTLAWKEGIA